MTVSPTSFDVRIPPLRRSVILSVEIFTSLCGNEIIYSVHSAGLSIGFILTGYVWLRSDLRLNMTCCGNVILVILKPLERAGKE